MKRFVEGEDRRQGVLLPEFLDDYVSVENPVRVIDVFVEALDLGALGFEGVVAEATGRPAYHPGLLLKIYVYGYINQVASSRRLEREAQRNVEMMWLTGRLAPDFKTIADFRKDNGPAIRATCRRFIERMAIMSSVIFGPLRSSVLGLSLKTDLTEDCAARSIGAMSKSRVASGSASGRFRL
jgi:transposase